MQYNRYDIVHSNCPICNHSTAKLIHLFTKTDVPKHLGVDRSKHNYLSLIKQVESLWGSESCSFVECLGCTFSYAMPFIAGDSKFYDFVYTREIKYPEWKWDFEVSYNAMSQILQNKKREEPTLLEIGAGNGSFLKKIASDLILSKNILATEFSEFGKEEINGYGIKCLNIGIDEINIEAYESKFDFICIFQVLEHLDRLNEVFDHITRLMKKEASLFITVPNNIQRNLFEKHGVIEDVPPIHIGRWNRRSFDVIASKFGLEIVNYLIEPSNFKKVIYRYLNLRYKNFFLVQLLNSVTNRNLRKLIQVIVFFPLAILNINVVYNLQRKNLGVAQWIHFKKRSNF